MDPAALPAHGDSTIDTPRARNVLAIAILFSVLSTLFVLTRFWARTIRKAGFGWDDWLIFFALVFYWGEFVAVYYALYQGGLGHHIQTLSLDQITALAKVTFGGQFTYALAQGFARCSICALLTRIFVTRWFKLTVWALQGANIIWMVFSVLYLLLRCHPFSANWTLVADSGTHCASLNGFLIGVACVGLVIDVATWVLPIPMIFQLQLPLAQQLLLSGIFAVGIVDIVVGIVRIVTIVHVDFMDETYAAVPSIEWILAEPGIAIIVACSCVLRPVLEKVFPRRFFSSIKNSVKRSQASDPESQKNRSGTFGRLDDDNIELVPQKSMPSKTEPDIYRKDSNVAWVMGAHDGVIRIPERSPAMP